MANRLSESTSPYLLQHAENPVDWWPWCDEAFAEAVRRNVPVFLSVGYSTCHWCHVMAHESFEDPETARLLNADFVSIKVDREERPDVDALYMDAVQAIAGRGGWPMTVFLDTSGRPFFGGTYFPRDDMPGMPGFGRILAAIVEMWNEDADAVAEQAERLTDALRSATVKGPPRSGADLPDEIIDLLWQLFDAGNGGFGGAPKFPQPMTLSFCLSYAHRTGNRRAAEIVDRTLERMALGGIYDQIGGGFSRYSVDESWSVPHFEKMLYDNAQLARLYLWAGAALDSDFFRRIATETLDYLIREMRDPEGGFYAATDADSEGVEGRFFAWSRGEIRDVAANDADVAIRHFGASEVGNFDGRNVLTAERPLEQLEHSDRSAVERARRAMYAARSHRIPPARDEKVVAAWNGLTLRALADAARVFGRSDFASAAQSCAEFILGHLVIDGELMRSWRAGSANVAAFADDHAQVALGFISYFELTGEWRWISEAQRLSDLIVENFLDPEDGLPFTAASDDLVARPKSFYDNAEPGAASATAELFARLAVLTGEDSFAVRADRIIDALAPVIDRAPTGFGGLMTAIERRRAHSLEIVIVGRDEEADAMRVVAGSRYLPNATLVTGVEGAPPDSPLIEGRLVVDTSTAYVCHDTICELPVQDSAALADVIDRSLSDAS